MALLEREGFSFRDVVRTWFYLRDILDWYGSFNAARNAFFRRMGLVGAGGESRIPASTGIEGSNARGGWCTLDLVAVRPRAAAALETSGSTTAGRTRRPSTARPSPGRSRSSSATRATSSCPAPPRSTITARPFTRATSSGRRVYTLEAVEALLEGAGARLADVGQATAFLKHASDGAAFERLVDRSEIADVPLVTTVADVCRRDLLFEIDATAVVPRGGGCAVRPRRAALSPALAAPRRSRRRAGGAARAAARGAWWSRSSRWRGAPAVGAPGAHAPRGSARAAGSCSCRRAEAPRAHAPASTSAADPEVSFDGKSILFAAKKRRPTRGASSR